MQAVALNSRQVRRSSPARRNFARVFSGGLEKGAFARRQHLRFTLTFTSYITLYAVIESRILEKWLRTLDVSTEFRSRVSEFTHNPSK